MKETITKITESILHPERTRQQALGELYQAAVTQLQSDQTTFFPKDPVWVTENHRRSIVQTDQGTVILDTNVTADNEMTTTPSSILIKDNKIFHELTKELQELKATTLPNLDTEMVALKLK